MGYSGGWSPRVAPGLAPGGKTRDLQRLTGPAVVSDDAAGRTPAVFR